MTWRVSRVGEGKLETNYKVANRDSPPSSYHPKERSHDYTVFVSLLMTIYRAPQTSATTGGGSLISVLWSWSHRQPAIVKSKWQQLCVRLWSLRHWKEEIFLSLLAIVATQQTFQSSSSPSIHLLWWRGSSIRHPLYLILPCHRYFFFWSIEMYPWWSVLVRFSFVVDRRVSGLQR